MHDLTVTADVVLPEHQTPDELGSDVSSTLYRVVQEGLTNVVKHAGASTARVSVRLDERCLVAEIGDDGRGFAVEEAASGFGLTGMRERIHTAGGTLTIDSSETGTTIKVTLPVSQESSSRVGGAAGTPMSSRLSA
jgi:signal transduction histidine kinase